MLKKIAIIGFGRFGKLFASILNDDFDVFVVSNTEDVDDKFTKINYSDLSKIDLVIPCVPIGAMIGVLRKIKPFLRKGSTVMDVCSVKINPCKWMEEELPKNVDILGSHPMFGPDSARDGISGLSIVFCPVRISDEKYNVIKNIFRKLKIIEVTPDDHDKQVATSLSLVHFIGRGLNELDLNNQQISTLGFKRLLQLKDNVVNDSVELFKDMNKFNPYAKGVRDKYLKSLQKVNSMLDLDD